MSPVTLPAPQLPDLTPVLKVMSAKQIQSIVECRAPKINIWSGAVSSGKTIASLLAFVIACATAPKNGLIFCVGRTMQTVERNLIEVLQQTAGPFGPIARYIQHTRGSTVASIFGRTVHLIGANDVKAEGRIRGSTASLIYIDEATLIPEGFFMMCLSRLRVPGARMLATTNPDGPQHWLRKNILLRGKELNMRQWHFILDDNPSLAEGYKNDLKREYTGLFYRRFILGEWCLAEGAVYDSWDPDVHVVKEVPLISEWIGLGVDHGTVNPFAALVLGRGVDNRLYFTNEYRYDSKKQRGQKTDFEYSADLREWMSRIQIPGTSLFGVQPRWVVIDPAASSFRVQLHKDGVPSVLADNAVLNGIRTVSSLLATGRLLVHESCTGWINEIPGYSWDPKAAERGEDAPIKIDDHSLDGGRYVIRTTESQWMYALMDPQEAMAAAALKRQHTNPAMAGV